MLEGGGGDQEDVGGNGIRHDDAVTSKTNERRNSFCCEEWVSVEQVLCVVCAQAAGRWGAREVWRLGRLWVGMMGR